MSTDSAPFLSPTDLARRWQVSIHTIRDLRKRGQLPEAAKLPVRNLRWHRSDIEAFEQKARPRGGTGTAGAVQSSRVSRHMREAV